MKKIKRFIPALALLAAGGLGRLLVSGAETDILIQAGAAAYRTLSWITRGLMLAGLLLLIPPLLQLAKQRRQQRASQALIDRARAENRKNAPLSNRGGRYQEEEIRSYLIQLFDTMPPKFTPYLERYQAQLDRMNSYQARLSRMLKQNGADDLTEAEVLLDKLEQNIFGMMRRVFNWLTMYDAASPEQPLFRNLEDAAAHNEKALEQAGRLCAAITEYINNQGSKIDVTNSVKNFIELLKEEIV